MEESAAAVTTGSGFGHTAVHGAVVCAANGVATPPGGNGVNYEQGGSEAKTCWQQQQGGGPVGSEQGDVAMNNSYHFHNL